MFKVRGYKSRAAGEGGRATPAYLSTTFNFTTAVLVARQVSQSIGAAVIENQMTGNRTWFSGTNDPRRT